MLNNKCVQSCKDHTIRETVGYAAPRRLYLNWVQMWQWLNLNFIFPTQLETKIMSCITLCSCRYTTGLRHFWRWHTGRWFAGCCFLSQLELMEPEHQKKIHAPPFGWCDALWCVTAHSDHILMLSQVNYLKNASFFLLTWKNKTELFVFKLFCSSYT